MIRKILGLLKKDSNVPAPEEAGGVNDLEHFVDYVVRALVDQPDQVCVASVENEKCTVIQVKCAKDDIGKVIGKNGKTISAIRALVNGSGKRIGKEMTVEVTD